MTATLHLNLSDCLTADELQALTEIATSEHKTLERVLYEAAKERADRNRRPQPPTSPHSARFGVAA